MTVSGVGPYYSGGTAQKTYDLIASQTFSNQASATFASIPSTYTDLVLEGTVWAASASSFQMQVGNSTVQTGTVYSFNERYGTGSTLAGTQGTNQSAFIMGNDIGIGTSSNDCLSIKIDLMSYSKTNMFKTVLYECGRTAGGVARGVGLFRSTASIDTISVFSGNGSINIYGTLSLFGIQAA